MSIEPTHPEVFENMSQEEKEHAAEMQRLIRQIIEEDLAKKKQADAKALEEAHYYKKDAERSKREADLYRKAADHARDKAYVWRTFCIIFIVVSALLGLLLYRTTTEAEELRSAYTSLSVPTPTPKKAVSTPKPTSTPTKSFEVDMSSGLTAQERIDLARQKMAESEADSNSNSTTLVPATLPANGEVLIQKGILGNNPGYFTVETKGTEHYYLKLVSCRTGNTIMTMFVRGGMSAEFEVPLGEYELRYACGDVWYGTSDLFGESTSYAKADETFLFEDYGNSVTWWTVELYLQDNGNLSTSYLDPEDF